MASINCKQSCRIQIGFSSTREIKANNLPDVAKQKSKIRISLRTILVLVALAATGLYLVDFNQSRILYGHKSAAYSYGGFNVPSGYDFQELERALNSINWRNNFRREFPAHTRLIQSWNPNKHGFTIAKQDGIASTNFSIGVQSPMYCVRLRTFRWGWPIITDKFIENGEDGVEKKVGDLNGQFYLHLMEEVQNTVHQVGTKE